MESEEKESDLENVLGSLEVQPTDVSHCQIASSLSDCSELAFIGENS